MTPLRRAVFVAFVVGLGLSITLSQLSLLLLTLFWLWELRDPEVRAAAQWPLWKPVLAFTAVTLVAALLSGEPAAALLASKGLLLVAALYVTADALRTVDDAGWFLSSLVVVTLVASVVGLAQVALCPGPGVDYGPPAWLYHRCVRARGFFSIYMTLAGVLSLVLLATLPGMVQRSDARRWLGPAWLVLLLGLAATYVRGAWLGFGAGVLSLLPATRRGRWLLMGGLVILALAAVAGPQPLRQRFLSMGDPEDVTLRERIYMWRSGLEIWRQRPWLGVGPGGVKREYRRFALPEAVKKQTGHVHDTPLQILVERGALGLAAWLWIWGAFYTRAIRLLRGLPWSAVRERALVAGSVAAITGFLVGGLTEYNFGDSEVVMVAWTIMALPFVVGGRGADALPLVVPSSLSKPSPLRGAGAG